MCLSPAQTHARHMSRGAIKKSIDSRAFVLVAWLPWLIEKIAMEIDVASNFFCLFVSTDQIGSERYSREEFFFLIKNDKSKYISCHKHLFKV
jgi:hypothetical protein